MIDRIKKEVIKFLPLDVRNNISDDVLANLEEIRLRVNKPVIFRYLDSEFVFQQNNKQYLLSKEELNLCFESICNNSVYAYQEELSNGFITIAGGHRVGLCGKPLYRDGKIYSMKDISGINIRIARQIIGCAIDIANQIYVDNRYQNTLIVSQPGFGKTTLLRDLIRTISNNGFNMCVIDERSEIAASFRGVAQNDVGIRTDIMDGVFKSDGIKMMVRSMKPDYIATDEIGTYEDCEAILYAVNSGVGIIATAHGSCMEDLKRKVKLYDIIKNGIFKKIIFLNCDREIEVFDYGDIKI